MSFDPLSPPQVQDLPASNLARRRDHLLLELNRIDSPHTWRVGGRRVKFAIVLGAVFLVLVTSVAVAVVTDLVSRQDQVHKREAKSTSLAPQPSEGRILPLN